MAPRTDPQRLALASVLADFETTPGRYPLALREPRLLFDEVLTVLQLAAGRQVAGMDGLDEAALRRAARFFVRTALLRPDNDPLALLGLTPGFAPEALREHYRLLIRMTHPDFAVSGEDRWPADAAQRINTAHDALLTNPDLGAPARPAAPPSPEAGVVRTVTVPPRGAVPASAPRPAAKPRRRPAQGTRRWWTAVPLTVRWAVAVTGLLMTAVALLMHNSGPDRGALVARKDTRVAPVAGAAIGEPRLLAEKAMALSEEGDQPATPAGPLAALTEALADLTEAPATLALAGELKAPPPGLEPPAVAAPRPQRSSPPATMASQTSPAEQAPATAVPPVMPPVTHSTAPMPVATSAPPAATPESSTALVPALVPTAMSTAPANASSITPSTAPPSLADTQQTMVNVLAGLQSGNPEQVLQWLEPAWRDHPSARAFSGQYRQLLAGRRVASLGRAAFDSRTSGAQLVVHGTVELQLLDTQDRPQHQPTPLHLQLRAHFQTQQGRPVLTELVAAQARP